MFIVDIMNVVVITGKNWDKNKVIQVIRKEKYRHNFFFGDILDIESLEKNLPLADEVWLFGEVDLELFGKIKDSGLEIWQMGSD